MAETRLENVQNAIVGSTVTTEGGDVLVNSQKVTNYFYSAQYQELKKQLDELDARFAKTQQKIAKYPDDEDFKAELLNLSNKRNEVQKLLDDLKQEVIRLAETFTKIPINSERLKLARQHFEIGDYVAARVVLDAEQMGSELDALLRREEQLQEQQAEVQTLRIDKAHEYLILARLTAVDFTMPDRIKQTIAYFEQSLKAAHTLENTFEYAYFLQAHNQFKTALPWYEEALTIRRRLAEVHPQTYLPDVATTLNNLGALQQATNEFPAALAAYEEALAIRRRLAKVHPQTYLPDIAMTLNNLGVLQRVTNEFPAALAAYEEALEIYRRVAETNPQTYLPDIAMTLNNLAALQQATNEFPAAQAAYEKALEIYRRVAETNPQTYLPDVAMTLNNLAALQQATNEFPAAQAAYEKALAIRRRLAKVNPQTYLPDVATTLNNLAILLEAKNEFPAALNAYEEALAIYRRVAKAIPQTYLPYVATTLNNLAVLQRVTNEFPAALAAYEEALTIRRRLAETNPQTYLPDVAMTAMNLSIFYLQALPDRERSLAHAREALLAALPFVEVLPAAENYTRTTLQVVEAWGVDPKTFIEKTIQSQQGKAE